MAEEIREREDSSAKWMGWLGIIAGIVSFFYAPFLFGGAAIILGLITAFSKANGLGWWAVVLGVIGAALNIVFHGIRLW